MELVERFQSVEDTVFTGRNLRPDLVCFFRVVLESARKEWTSARSGRISYGSTGIQLLDVRVDAQNGAAEPLEWYYY